MPEQTASYLAIPPVPPTPAAARLLVLLVGIDCYDPVGSVPSLRGCAADAQTLCEFLVRRLDVPPERIVLLVNEQATRAAIVAAWQQHLLAQVQAHDQILFCFSGHGSQAPALGADEPDALDETLVAFDSRGPGGCDILDKELAYLIAAAEERGAQVTVLLDCCHSGSGTRAAGQPAVRQAAPAVTASAAATLLAPLAELLAAAQRPTRHILFAAAAPHELANEYFDPLAQRWYGAMTYFLLDTLGRQVTARPWSTVHDQVLARVHTAYPRQTPQLEGPSDQFVFGGATAAPTGAYLRVLDMPEAGVVRVDGGAVLGLRLGGELALYLPNAGTSGPPAVLAAVEAVTSGEARARLTRPAVVPPGSRARILSFGDDDPTYAVVADDEQVRDQIATARAGRPSPFLRVMDADARETARFVVHRLPDRYRVAALTGETIVDVPGTTADDAARVVRALEHLAIFHNVLNLRNPTAEAALRDAVELRGPSLAQGTSSPAPLPTREVGAGRPVRFELQNVTADPVFVVVFRLGADYSIRRLRPGRGAVQALAPGRAGVLRVSDVPGEMGASQAEQRIVYKIFVLTESIALDALQLPALTEALAAPAANAAPATRSTGRLGALLTSIRYDGTRRLRLVSAAEDERWTVQNLEILVRHGLEAAHQ